MTDKVFQIMALFDLQPGQMLMFGPKAAATLEQAGGFNGGKLPDTFLFDEDEWKNGRWKTGTDQRDSSRPDGDVSEPPQRSRGRRAERSGNSARNRRRTV